MPDNPSIYHIVHLDHLPSILRDLHLYSQHVMQGRSGNGTEIAMGHVKQKRLTKQIGIGPYPNRTVSEFVPFYFCPRSVMLYAIHAKNAYVEYKGGQRPIIHLRADLNAVMDWADTQNRQWLISSGNASSNYVNFMFGRDKLNELHWDSINKDRWNHPPEVKEQKQAEFLLYNDFPWGLVQEIGVYDSSAQQAVQRLIQSANHKPTVSVRNKEWYY